MDDDAKLRPEEHDQEYETQLLGCTPCSVIDKVYDTASSSVDDAVMTMYQTLTKKYVNIGKEVIRKGSEDLWEDIMKSLDKICDKLDVYLLSNILHIPKTILLPEDAIHEDEELQLVDESALDNNIEALQTQIRNVTNSIVNRYKEKAQQDSLLDKYQNMIGLFDEIETYFKDAGLQQLDENIATFKCNTTSLLGNMNSLEPMSIDSDSGFHDSNEVSMTSPT